MSSFRAPNGVDLDLIFAARASVTAGAVGYRNTDGLDLNQRYEGLGSQSPSAITTNFRTAAGIDLRNVFATTAGVPVNFSPSATSDGGSEAGISFNSSGNIIPSPGGTPTVWFSVPRANIGNEYDIIFQNASTPGLGNQWLGTFNTWLQLNATRGITFYRSAATGTGSGTCTATIRRRSDNVNVCTGTLSFAVAIDG